MRILFEQFVFYGFRLQGDGNNNNNSNNDNNNNSNNNNKRKRVERTLSKPTIITQNTSQPKALDPPKIPSVGQYFDIHVPMAANPGNFFVQPFDKDALGVCISYFSLFKFDSCIEP